MSLVDRDRPSTWKKYSDGLCDNCVASCCMLPVEVKSSDLIRLGFTDEEARNQFGFLMDAFQFGAPPHGGIAFGFDRLCSLFGGADSIRDFIAFPKNNAGRDVMIDSPSTISEEQLKELGLLIK